MIWSAQRRKKRTQKTASARTPITATRRPIWPPGRVGGGSAGSGLTTPGRRSSSGSGVRLDSDAHLAAGSRRDGEEAPAEPVERPCEEQVQRDGRKEHAREELGGGDRVSEHEVQDGRAERDADRGERDRDERRMRRREARRVAEAARPVAREREKQGRQAERLDR